jgi:hypothetical protein
MSRVRHREREMDTTTTTTKSSPNLYKFYVYLNCVLGTARNRNYQQEMKFSLKKEENQN